MKITIGRLSPAKVIEAAAHDFEVDVTPEMMKALLQDEDAQRLFVATKGTTPDADTATRLSAIEVQMKALIDGLPALLDEAVKKALPQGEPLQGEVLTALKGFDPSTVTGAISALDAKVTGLMEKATQAALTAESVKTELASRMAAAPVLGGEMSPQQKALLNQMGSAPQGPFSRNVALNPQQA